MTLSVAGIGRRKIGGPLGAGQPERLAHGPLGEGGDPRGVEHATFAVQRMQAHEPFDLAGYDRHARPGGLSAPHDLARRLADERRLVERPLAGDHELRFGEAASNPTRARTHSAPRVSWALAKYASPAPSPPAAPPPGSIARSPRPCRAINAARRSSPRERSFTPSGPAPFCGPNTGAAPCGPTSGVVTSASAMTRAARPHPPSSPPSCASDPPPSGSGSPWASRNAQPSPRAAPVPPSTVADPPRPTTTVFAPRSTASQISSPTPRHVALNGSSCSGLRSAIPQAVALSKIAVSGSTQPS